MYRSEEDYYLDSQKEQELLQQISEYSYIYEE
jgi:hypothetical protein